MNMPNTDADLALKLVDPARASGEVAEAFKLLPDINIFRALANAETLFPPFMAYLARLFQPLELDKALARMIVLLVVRRSDCAYAWRQNVIVARSVGVSEAQIEALDRGDTAAACFTPLQRSAFTFTDEVMVRAEATPATTASLRAQVSDRVVTEMLCVIGTYMFVARLARTGRVPLDAQPAASPQ